MVYETSFSITLDWRDGRGIGWLCDSEFPFYRILVASGGGGKVRAV